jgi:hypothetical protein
MICPRCQQQNPPQAVAGTGAAKGRPLPKVARVAYPLGAVHNHSFFTDLVGPRNVAIRRRSGEPAAGGLLARHSRRDVAAIGASRTVRDEHPPGDRADAARPSHGALHPQRAARRVREQGSSRLRVRSAARLGRALAVPDRRPRLRPPAQDRINDGERPRGRLFESSPLHSGHEPSIGRVPNDSLEL